MADKYPEILSDLVAGFTELLEQDGLSEERALRLAALLVEEIRARWGGQKVKVSKDQVAADMTRAIAKALAAEGLGRPHARQLAELLVDHVRLMWGRTKVYIPKGASFICSIRNADIVARWNGRNTRDLCVEYDLTESRLYQIVVAAKRRPKRT